jgi:cholesterol transport system auxiliary component
MNACPSQARRVATIALALTLGLGIAGCQLTRPAPVKRTYLLEPTLPTAAASMPKPVTVRVGSIGVAAPFRDRALVYRMDALTYESDFYNEFFVSPASMIAEATVRALSASGVFTRVLPANTASDDGDYVLEGFVSALYGDARKPLAAEVAITFYLSRTAYPGRVAWSREYRERVPLADTTPDALASSLNTALGNVLAALVRDLGALNFPAP